MTCYRPVSITSTKKKAYRVRLKEQLIVPCGTCIGCLLRRARDWTVRNCHEFTLHDEACFLTLTYRDDALPMAYDFSHITSLPTLFKPHLRDFIKRLRSRLSPIRISFFACGEYGSRTERPHYHVLIYGFRPSDLVLHSRRLGIPYYSSLFLDEVWGHGNVIVGDVTPESIAYVSRYTIDKLHARTSDPDYISTGRTPEYVVMSRNPSIGLNFYRKFYKQFLATDSVSVSPSFKSSLPRYYDKLYKRFFGYLDSNDFVFTADSILDVDLRSLNYSPEVIKANRIVKASLNFFDSLPLRLEAKENAARSRLKRRPPKAL